MEKIENDIKKICCLYVSDWHLSVMLVPYLNNQINEDVGIVTIFKNDVADNIKTLIQKLNLKNEEKLLQLDYKKIDSNKEIQQKIDRVINHENIVIINNGSKIEEISDYIEQYLMKNQIANKKIKIVNCYEVLELKTNMENKIEEYKIILNTSGEKSVEELYM